ncbi:HAD family hydrolase [Kaistia geumhonensis]|uniref:Cof subfamily protein (Haloacid dehalogenase superfamily) n=1 Tax=Kaistia geumhonensis TaxID=410839 RepID=A0ABU0M9H1_9HYPH|nr:HAD family hydrolase [Kaistia geumhonensis]MCX5480680.1 HAD family hydrolase [Kaistia geumhonensis]MDQ0517616.1 Cof subfamily protein (haloacid dehalogenase superfamily) [Kaistia geumhonensis]
MNARALPKRIRLFVSDVDGTIVTPSPDKRVTEATIAAVDRLRAAGGFFSIVSSRPPRGMLHVAEPLKLDLFAGFNGSSIVRGDLSPVERHFVPEAAARIAAAEIAATGADVWIFSGNDWYVTDRDGPYVAHEEHTVSFDPVVVPSFEGHFGEIGKLVGSSKDFDRLAETEGKLQALLGDTAAARRSQNYYLDVTHPTADKGHAVTALARHFGVPLEEVAVIGDMSNDLPMFAVAGLAIAMGNAHDDIKAQADLVTRSNAEDGVAHAIETMILPLMG